MKESIHDILRQMKRKYRLLRFTETLCVSIAVYLITYTFLYFTTADTTQTIALTLVFSGVLFLYLSQRLHLFRITDERIIRYLNHTYPALEESVDLLAKDESTLNSLQLLQRARVLSHFSTLQPHVVFPHKLRQGAVILGVSLFVNLTLTSLMDPPSSSVGSNPKNNNSPIVTKNILPPALGKAVVSIFPPAYTSLSPSVSPGLAIDAPEGSAVGWELTFTDTVKAGYLVFGGTDSVAMNAGSVNILLLKKIFLKSTFYQLIWKNAGQTWSRSDYYTLTIVPDQPPKIAVENLAQFTSLKHTDQPVVQVSAMMSDDYGLRDAFITATVSKGSGESVKFREEKISFTSPTTIAGKKIKGQRGIDLLKLGMEPGDELYFYIEATDHHIPQPNRTRTETFFIALQDTTRDELNIEAGLGVDLMPEYFRSQRQIIIDSEKLLREKKNISKKEFNVRSNELGYDQKVLRLRYGEFLGEEFESGIGPAQEQSADEDVVKQFGHAHDTENEHNLVPQKQAPDTHKHEDVKKNADGKEESPIAAFAHAHDNTEEATFFEQSIKAKLKAALAIMWDAELHLRLFEPAKSLPYQYQALKLLKEISNDSRIYVHRTGFDPPPVKEEKRLTGDLDEIKSSTGIRENKTELTYPAIRKTLTLIERLLDQKTIMLTPGTRIAFQEAGNELSAIVLAKPATDLKVLSAMKKIIDDEVPPTALNPELQSIYRELWKVLPTPSASPTQRQGKVNRWDNAFIKELDDLNR